MMLQKDVRMRWEHRFKPKTVESGRPEFGPRRPRAGSDRTKKRRTVAFHKRQIERTTSFDCRNWKNDQIDLRSWRYGGTRRLRVGRESESPRDKVLDMKKTEWFCTKNKL